MSWPVVATATRRRTKVGATIASAISACAAIASAKPPDASERVHDLRFENAHLGLGDRPSALDDHATVERHRRRAGLGYRVAVEGRDAVPVGPHLVVADDGELAPAVLRAGLIEAVAELTDNDVRIPLGRVEAVLLVPAVVAALERARRPVARSTRDRLRRARVASTRRSRSSRWRVDVGDTCLAQRAVALRGDEVLAVVDDARAQTVLAVADAPLDVDRDVTGVLSLAAGPAERIRNAGIVRMQRALAVEERNEGDRDGRSRVAHRRLYASRRRWETRKARAWAGHVGQRGGDSSHSRRAPALLQREEAVLPGHETRSSRRRVASPGWKSEFTQEGDSLLVAGRAASSRGSIASSTGENWVLHDGERALPRSMFASSPGRSGLARTESHLAHEGEPRPQTAERSLPPARTPSPVP